MNTAAYQRVIDLLIEGKIDHEAIAIGLAKRNPVLFLELVDALKPDVFYPQWMFDVVKHIHFYEMVPAIKLYRTETASSLKEAKDVIHNVRLAAYNSGWWEPHPDAVDLMGYPADPVHPSHSDNLNDLIEVYRQKYA